MKIWLGRHAIAVMVVMLTISWFVHLYLLASAVLSDNIAARTYELFLVSLHHIVLLVLFVLSVRRRRRNGSF